MEVLDADVEDMLWVKLSQDNGEALTLAVCYIPPESSSRGGGAEETLQMLAEQVEKFGSLGPLVMCGDFNARCGDLDMDSEGVPVRNVIDVVKTLTLTTMLCIIL